MNDNRQWRNFETRFMSLRDELRKAAKERGIYYELSGGNSFYHFEFKVNQEEEDYLNGVIDQNSICEM